MTTKKEYLKKTGRLTISLLGILLAVSTITSMGNIEVTQENNHRSISIDNGECMNTTTSKICYTTLTVVGTDIDTNIPLQAVEKPNWREEPKPMLEVYSLIWRKG